MYDQYDEGMNMYDDGGNYYHKCSRKNRKRKRKLQQEESFIVDIEQRYIQAKHKKNKRLNTSSTFKKGTISLTSSILDSLKTLSLTNK